MGLEIFNRPLFSRLYKLRKIERIDGKVFITIVQNGKEKKFRTDYGYCFYEENTAKQVSIDDWPDNSELRRVYRLAEWDGVI